MRDLLDTTSYDSIGSGNMWNSENLIDLGVNGVYNTLRYPFVGKERWMLDQDGFVGMDRNRTSWIIGSSTFKSGVITANDGLFSKYWQQHYEGIHRANDALANLVPGVPISEGKLARLIAEVKFLRAYFYFNLNQVFKGVPIYLEPVSAEEINRPRDTEASVWQTIIDDLTDCINETNLPDMYSRGDAEFGRVTKAASYALRGKAYLYMKEYSKAESDLRKVGELGPSLFQGNYKEIFSTANEQSPEMIFSVQNVALSGLGSRTQKYVGTRVAFGSNWNNYLPHPDFIESFENADGSPFKWDDYLPGYSTMTPEERVVFFLRDGMTEKQIADFKTKGANMNLYLKEGNEARIKAAYDNRDPRLKATIITPYSTFNGATGTDVFTYTLRWPYVGSDRAEPFDIRTDSNNKFYYLWRKWVYEGNSIENREYGPTDMPLIRYADVLLMLAEAINEQGFNSESVAVVNKIRQRAGVPPLQISDASLPTYVSNQDGMRIRIQNERRWELPLEGINLFDEMRWESWKQKKFYDGNGAKEIYGIQSYPFSWRGDYVYTWAIPRTEIERNSKLTQNSGWD
ncbi:MAG: RagB/SusD family nutrient uptake outer membrane protein [Bacteroidales bacterium]